LDIPILQKQREKIQNKRQSNLGKIMTWFQKKTKTRLHVIEKMFSLIARFDDFFARLLHKTF